MARSSEGRVSQGVITTEKKSLPQLDAARLSRELAIDWSEMRHMRDQFWRGINQIPFVQIERSRELLQAIEKGTIARKVFTSNSKWKGQDRQTVLSYLTAFKKPLTAHLEQLQRAPTQSLILVVSVILNEFPRSPERTLSIGRDVEKRWKRWGVVEQDLLLRYDSREQILQTSDLLGKELLDLERDFGGTRKGCEPLVRDLLGARDQYVAIRDALFQEHANLIWASAGSYDTLMTIPDVRQEASVGLLYAIERFEPALGNQFSTYVSFALREFRARCLNSIRKEFVSIPLDRVRSFEFIKKEHKKGHVDIDLIVSELGITKDTARALLVVAGGHTELPPELVDCKQELPEGAMIDDEIWRALEKAHGALTEREYDVFSRHHGLYGKSETFSAIGQSYNPTLTRQRVQQIEAKAMEKISGIMRRLFPEG